MSEIIFEFLKVFLTYFYKIYTYILFARIIFSWLRPRPNALTRFVADLTDPLLRFLKRFIPNFGPLDFTPIFAFILLDLCYKLSMYFVIMLSNHFL